MCYSVNTPKGMFYLHRRVYQTKTGKEVSLYFFAKGEKPQTDIVKHQSDLPSGYETAESHGMPILRKATAAAPAASAA